MLTKEKLGMQIKHYMTEKRMTQKELAEAIQITPSKLSNYITGKNYPPIDKLVDIADKLEVSLDLLLQRQSSSTTDDLPSKEFEVVTCGDVARFLFTVNKAYYAFHISAQQETYEWQEDSPDFDIYSRETHTGRRARYWFSFGSTGEWDAAAKALNEAFANWKLVKSVTGNQSHRNDLISQWQSGALEELDKIPLDPLVLVDDEFKPLPAPQYDNDDDELPF